MTVRAQGIVFCDDGLRKRVEVGELRVDLAGMGFLMLNFRGNRIVFVLR